MNSETLTTTNEEVDKFDAEAQQKYLDKQADFRKNLFNARYHLRQALALSCDLDHSNDIMRGLVESLDLIQEAKEREEYP